jgi:peroxiredoxin
MIRTLFLAALATFALAGAMPAQAAPAIGQPAPDFTGTDSNGKTHKLSDYKGKIVVLEWTNPGCPFVMKHYDSNNMQKLQADATAKGIIWLSINSSAEGKEGNETGEQANKYIADKGAKPTARILDPKGEIGHLYDAKTTPHMFVVDKDGTLVYEGAIDSDDSFKPEAIESATNYVSAALKALEEGKPVAKAQTKPYGCSVKY